MDNNTKNINNTIIKHPYRFNVVIRIKPTFEDDQTEYTVDEDLYICSTKLNEREIKIIKPEQEERIFDFDRILGPDSSQLETYNRTASKIVDDVLKGYNGTIMAYGQTGSGKTYTIFGVKSSMDYQTDMSQDMGIVPRAIKQVFKYINENQSNISFKVSISFMQIYMEQITDLIPDIEEDGNSSQPIAMVFSNRNTNMRQVKNALNVREDAKTGIYIEGLKKIRVKSEEELSELIRYGSRYRITSATSMNKTSSRSHAILQIMVEQVYAENKSNEQKQRHYLKGLLTIVDLAGSERISKTGSEGLRLDEAKKINMSISALGNVINSLANNSNVTHIPFRDSKLTRVLTECLGGNSKTAICACVSPYLSNYDETLTTLQFASRAIKIKVDPHINEKIESNNKGGKLVEFKNLKNSGLKKSRSKSEIRNINEQAVSSSSPGLVKNSQENSELIENFQHMILHLQNELAKSTVTIFNMKDEILNSRLENEKLKEENKSLKNKLAHYHF